MDLDKSRVAQFLALGLRIPEDHQDRTRYFSLQFRQRASTSDVAEITLMSPGDILFLYTDGVYDGSDAQDRGKLEAVIREHCLLSAKDICNPLLELAVVKTTICSKLEKKTGLMTRQHSSSRKTEPLQPLYPVAIGPGYFGVIPSESHHGYLTRHQSKAQTPPTISSRTSIAIMVALLASLSFSPSSGSR